MSRYEDAVAAIELAGEVEASDTISFQCITETKDGEEYPVIVVRGDFLYADEPNDLLPIVFALNCAAERIHRVLIDELEQRAETQRVAAREERERVYGPPAPQPAEKEG